MGLLTGGCCGSRYTRSDSSVSVLHRKRRTTSSLTGFVKDPSTLVKKATTVDDCLDRARTREEVRNWVLSIRNVHGRRMERKSLFQCGPRHNVILHPTRMPMMIGPPKLPIKGHVFRPQKNDKNDLLSSLLFRFLLDRL